MQRKWVASAISLVILSIIIPFFTYAYQNRPLVDYYLAGPTSWDFNLQTASRTNFTVNIEFRNRGQTDAPLKVEVFVNNSVITAPTPNATETTIDSLAAHQTTDYGFVSVGIKPLPHEKTFAISCRVSPYYDGTISGLIASIFSEVRAFNTVTITYTEVNPGVYNAIH